jgi:CheY-like chemotaxis protein
MADASGVVAETSTRRRLHVLVAEDNRVNQQLAARIIEKAGHAAVVAADGREALVAVERQTFDMVLMDVQMPEMDGLAATAAIRRRETETGGGRLPIIALTAHAMVGDREECLAAGMDDYLTKPVKGHELVAVLERVAATRGGEPASFDVAAALDYTGGDSDLLRELLGVFIEDAPGQTQAVLAAVARADAAGLREAAHCVKGSLRVLGAARGAGLAQELEHLGAAGSVADAEGRAVALAAEIERLLVVIANWLAGD